MRHPDARRRLSHLVSAGPRLFLFRFDSSIAAIHHSYMFRRIFNIMIVPELPRASGQSSRSTSRIMLRGTACHSPHARGVSSVAWLQLRHLPNPILHE